MSMRWPRSRRPPVPGNVGDAWAEPPPSRPAESYGSVDVGNMKGRELLGEGRRYPDWTSTIGHEGARDRGGHGQALALRFANLLRPERPRPADLADPGQDFEGLAWIGGSEV